jgi:hypothetical protein
MRNFPSTLLSSALALLAIGTVASPAMAAGAYYRAELATPPAAERLIVRGIVWKCAADGCVAGPSNSRALIDCSALARQLGTLRSFAVEGRALAPAELEKCNARAR